MLLLDGEDVLIRIYIYICIYNDGGDNGDDGGGSGENVVTRKVIFFEFLLLEKHFILLMF